MRIIVCSLVGFLNVVALLGITTLNGVCASGGCTFTTSEGITIVATGAPGALFALGTLVVVNGTLLLSSRGGKALIKMLFR